LILKFVKKAVS